MPIQRIQKFFNSPSELNLSLRYNSNFALGLGVLVGVMVLILIWPNPLGPLHQKLSDAIICGILAVIVFGINVSSLPPVLPQFFNPDRWTIGRDVAFTSWLFFIISSVNMLMLRALGWTNFEWNHFVGQQLFTLVMGIPPVTAMIVLRNQQLARQHLKEAMQFNQLLIEGPKASLLLKAAKMPLLGPPSEQQAKPMAEVPKKTTKPSISLQGDDKQLLSFFVEQLLVVHSEKGILHIYWVNELEEVQYKTLSVQLKNIESILAPHSSFVLRCHRFFWVNAQRVEKVESNARGLQLKMPNIPNAIPVSKSYLEDIKAYFK